MEKNKSLLSFNPKDPKSIMALLEAPTLALTEFITGFLTSSSNEWKFSAGKIVQSVIKKQLFETIGTELKHYREKGIIQEDIFETDINRISLSEILKFIDEESPDEIRFQAVKSVFLSSLSNDIQDNEKILAYELLKISKDLSSGEILILKICYEMKDKYKEEHSADSWISKVADKIGHRVKNLVELYEDKLVDKKLISQRLYSDRTGIQGNNFRLTSLGIKLCEYMSKYNSIE